MKNFCFIFLTIYVFAIYGFSQSGDNSAPVKWSYYKISDKNLKIKFPKLPVRLNHTNLCTQTITDSYYAYADKVVYELKIYEKAKAKIPDYCREKINFDENNFTNYLKQMQTRPDYQSVELAKKSEKKFYKFDKNYNSFKYSTWLLNDYKNFRWFEFTISTFKEKESEEQQFVESLKFEVDASAIEINAGSPVLLGDKNLEPETSDEKNKLKEKSEDSKSSPLNLILKPKPKYTDVARQTNTVGSVRMRVTFLPNGSIGVVTPVTTLGNGLTEQAIEAARKIAFLPQRQNDRRIAVTKVVVYTFSIY